MSDIWYYAEGEETRGPVQRVELLSILRQTSDPLSVLVWQSGFDNWVAVARVRELAEHLVRPPPLRRSVEQPPPIQVREPAVTVEEAAEFKDVKPELTGIGGWLVLLAFGQVMGVLRTLVDLGQYYQKPEHLKVFATFPVGMYGELALNLSYIALIIYTAVLFFRKSRKFPRFFIFEWIAVIAMPILGNVWISVAVAMHTGKPIEWIGVEPKEGGQIIAAALLAPIWIAYILRSRRVKNTFVN